MMGGSKSEAEPFVSVLTPVHNTEPYLAECIESVLNQTYQNFEYVIVDNASTDASGKIAARYAAQDRRIRLVKTDRLLSQIDNYCFALEQMSAEARYCKFAQADDWLYPNCLTEMVALAEKHPSVALVSSYRMRENLVHGIGLHPTRSFVPGREIGRMHLVDRVFMFGSPTTVLYRADVARARKPFYRAGRLHADTETAFELMLEHDFGFVHQILSFTRMQEASITGDTRDFAPDELDRVITVKRYARSFLSESECEAVSQSAWAEYYDAIARGFASRAEDSFWDYHRRGLATIGETINSSRVVLHCVRISLHAALSPLSIIRRLRHRNSAKQESVWQWIR